MPPTPRLWRSSALASGRTARASCGATGGADDRYGSVAALCGSIRIFAWVSGSPSAANASSTPSRPTVPVISGRGVDLALGEHVQGVAELQRRVAEDEAQVDLLVDRHRRRDLVGAHADADDDDAREQRRAVDDARRSRPGTPTHSKITGCFGAGAERLGRAATACHQPTGQALELLHACRRASSSADGTSSRWPRPAAAVNGESCAGSITTSAPHAVASARRPGEKSLATTVRTPLRLQQQDHRQADRPAADHDRHRRACRPRRGARRARPTAIGSVSAATSAARPLGTGSISDSCDEHLLGVGAGGVRPTGRPCRRRALPRSSGSATTGVPAGRLLAGSRARARRPRRRTRGRTRSAARSARSGRSRRAPPASAQLDRMPWRACRSEPQIPQRSTSQAHLPAGRAPARGGLDARARRAGR